MATARTKYRVGISGSYGGLNLGDEGILNSIIRQLRQSVSVEITVFSRNADDTRRRHRVERVVPFRRLSKSEVLPHLLRLDLLILGGGGILYDEEVKTYLREAVLAQEHDLPVMVYAVGAGPLKQPSTQQFVSDVLRKVSLLTVRERNARSVLEDAGVDREILVTADPAVLLEPECFTDEMMKKEGMGSRKPLIGISVREPGVAAPDLNEESYHALLANAADYLVDRYNVDIVFVPMETNVLDLQHSHAVIAQMLRPQHARVLQGNYTAGEVLSFMKCLVFAVGMRLHFLIFAALQGVPFVALPYASKVFGLLEDLQIDMPPLQLVNSGRLIAYIDRSWDQRAALAARIKKMLPPLKERARQTNAMAVELLKNYYKERRGRCLD